MAADPEMGRLAEALVAQWLESQGYEILQRRWHCRWGELDLVAQLCHVPAIPALPSSRTLGELAFVEVKARSRGNWDADGLLAITPKKQEKLWQTAQVFLATFPNLAECPCRFDVALVSCQRQKKTAIAPPLSSPSPLPLIQLGQPIQIDNYWLNLRHYLPGVFGL